MKNLLHRFLSVHSTAELIEKGCQRCDIPSRKVYLEKIREAYQQGLEEGYSRAQVIHIIEELKKEKVDGETTAHIYRYGS